MATCKICNRAINFGNMMKVYIWLLLAGLLNIGGNRLNKRLSKKKDDNARKGRTVIIKLLVGLLTIVFLCMGFFSYVFRDSGIQYYDTFEEFQSKSNQRFDIPDAAKELKMAIYNRVLAKTYMYSYVLEDEQLKELIEKTTQEKYSKTKEDGTVEIVFDKYYGIKVRDIDGVDENYNLDDFPHNLPFDTVIDDNVENYTVIYYYPTNTGATNKALLYNAETNRVLEYYYGQIK